MQISLGWLVFCDEIFFLSLLNSFFVCVYFHSTVLEMRDCDRIIFLFLFFSPPSHSQLLFRPVHVPVSISVCVSVVCAVQ